MTTANNEPNVIWAGEGEPPTHYMDGREAVLVPANASEGFHSADPMRLVRLSGGAIKLFVAKGGPAIEAGLIRFKRKQRREK